MLPSPGEIASEMWMFLLIRCDDVEVPVIVNDIS